jgi:hypothetical protein
MHAAAGVSASKNNRRKSFSAHVRWCERGAPLKSCATETTFTYGFLAGPTSDLKGVGLGKTTAYVWGWPGKPQVSKARPGPPTLYWSAPFHLS